MSTPYRLLVPLFGLSLSCAGSQGPAEAPSAPAPAGTAEEIPLPERYTAQQFHETTSIVGASFSHDESRLLVTSDETGVFNAYAVTLPAGEPTALTTSTEESIFAVSYFPEDNRFLYSADRGGNELSHLFVMEERGEAKDLTPGDTVKASFAGWSGDRKHFYVITNERDQKVFDLYRYATDGYQRKLAFKNTADFMIEDVSRDGRWVALTRVVNNADSDIYLWDAKRPRAAPVLLTKHDGLVMHSVQGFTPDSRQLLYSTNAHSEFDQVWSYDLKSRAHQMHTKADWDIASIRYSETGKYSVTAINQDARTVLHLLETETGKEIALPELPPGDISSPRFSRSETKLAFYLETDRSSSDLYVVDLESGELNRMTNTMNPAIDPANLVAGEVVRYKSFDGVEIPAILYRPKNASAERPAPATLWVHGGPGGQSRLGYSPTIQHLVNHGYAVLAVNNRGSSGYGKTFFHMDDRKHGDVDLKDCVWGRKYLESLSWIDGERVAITGGSYGGFMVLAALAFEPKAFDAGIDIFGVSNWYRTLTSIPPWWAPFAEALYAELGNPETDTERLKQISPLFSADKIERPLLVIQGANDPRVLKVESDEIVAAVKKNNVPVEYVVFADEGHGFRKKDNRITASETMVKFLDEHLARQSSPTRAHE